MNSEKWELSFRLGQLKMSACTHTHTCTQTHKYIRGALSQHTVFERQTIPKRVRDEKEEVRGAKTVCPRERLKIGWKDTAKRKAQKVGEKGQAMSEREGLKWFEGGGDWWWRRGGGV